MKDHGCHHACRSSRPSLTFALRSQQGKGQGLGCGQITELTTPWTPGLYLGVQHNKYDRHAEHSLPMRSLCAYEVVVSVR